MDITCPWCDGSGTNPYTQEPCSPCGGDGVFSLSDPDVVKMQAIERRRAQFAALALILDKLPATDVIHAYKILEATDITEYGELSDTNKTGYTMLISCGLVDLNDGTQAKTNLWSWFDAESTTRANLTELIS